ncbi:RNA-binding protein [Aciduricibacillus chroicocephali]|uniref:RNA-binding protein n=1 Tax=Aciduricibacillus chroicocephali TaxID=3054939 RepID=A0ABY9KY85_9BACI|nr:RNA-binding protein [Bacillaceae bacterium 44XB]
MSGLYQHFRKDEHPFIDQALSWISHVELVYESKLTDFLDPREQDILRSLVGLGNDTIRLEFYGANENSERKRAIIAPFYEEPVPDDFQIVVLEAKYPEKFVQLEHRDCLGAFMSLGIDRKKLGDMIVEEGLIQIAVGSEIASYVQANLVSIKHAKIKLTEVSHETFRLTPAHWDESAKTVSSLRLDAVIGEIYNLSRKVAQEAIAKGLVKVNYRLIEDSKFQLQEEDMISLRGEGRSKIIAIKGTTKKDKIRITCARLMPS